MGSEVDLSEGVADFEDDYAGSGDYAPPTGRVEGWRLRVGLIVEGALAVSGPVAV